MAEAKLFELTVSLNSYGRVVTEFNHVERVNLVAPSIALISPQVT